MKKDLYYVQKTGSYVGNCMIWWMPGGCGYTTHIAQAGLFSKEDAKDIIDHNHESAMWRQAAVEEAASLQVDSQRLPVPRKEGKTRLSKKDVEYIEANHF